MNSRGTARWVVMLLLAGCPASAEPEDSGAAERGDSSVPVDTDLPACGAQLIQFGACARNVGNYESFRSASGVVQAIERSTDIACGSAALGRIPEGAQAHVLVLADEDDNPIARVALNLPWSALPFVRVGDSVSVERTGAEAWLDSPSYGTLTLRGADGELLFWMLEQSNVEPVPELQVSDGDATCVDENDCGWTRRSLVVESGDETVSIDPGAAADVGDYVVLLGDNTRAEGSCSGYYDNAVLAAVRGSQASLEESE